MYLNGFIQLETGDKITGATCTVDRTPIIRFGALSVNMSWEDLKSLTDEAIRLQCANNAPQRVTAYASDVVSSLQGGM